MHPTVLHEDSTLVSSDFPAFARARIESAFPGARVIYHNGPCGNLSPRYHVKSHTFSEAERLGRRLGWFISDAVRNLGSEEFSDRTKVSGIQGMVKLPLRVFPPLCEAEGALTLASNDFDRLRREGSAYASLRTAECAVFGAEEVVTMSKAQASGAELHLSRRKGKCTVSGYQLAG